MTIQTTLHEGPCRGRCGHDYGEVTNPPLMREMAHRHLAVNEALEQLVAALSSAAELAPDYREALIAGERMANDFLARRLPQLALTARS